MPAAEAIKTLGEGAVGKWRAYLLFKIKFYHAYV